MSRPYKASVRDGAMWREAVPGDGMIGNYIEPVTVATAGNLTIGTDAILGGCGVFTGAAGAVAYTMPTATVLTAALPDMAIGDSISFWLCNTAAQVATITGVASVVVSGNATMNAASRLCILKKTTATAYTLLCL